MNSNQNSIHFNLTQDNHQAFEDFFLNKENLINSYYNQYRSYEMNHIIKENEFILNYSKYGLRSNSSTLLLPN